MSRKRSNEKKHKLNVFLLKEGCNDFKEALKDEDLLVAHSLVDADQANSRLFVKASEFFPPKWLEFFDGFLEVNIEKVFNSSSSAVLFIRSAGRIFVFSFGYGKGLLNLDLTSPQ